MASLPGGGMEMLITSSLEGQRRKAQTRNEKKLKQVIFFPHIAAHISDLCGLTLHLRAVMKVDLLK